MVKQKKRSRTRNQDVRSLERKVNVRSIRKRFLIVCEGKKTEPNYFRKFRTSKDVFDVQAEGIGADPSQVVECAIKFAEEYGYEVTGSKDDPDQVWCVFDRDSWTPENFNNAIQKAKHHKFSVAYSNEAFELWFVLHFEYLNTPILRRDYRKKLSDLLGQEYKKNSDTIYDQLIDKQKTAIQHAQKLLKQYKDNPKPAENNPSTTVHKLVEQMNEANS